MDETTIRAVWKKFEASVVPAEAPPYQREAMRTAFYGGATSLLDMMSYLADEMNNVVGMVILQRLYRERDEFEAEMEEIGRRNTERR
jgi:hypothetical protein